jgi:sulfide:quinone oxidoreductase
MPNGLSNYSGSRRVLIAGGGIAALEAMLALRALAEDRVTVEVLAPNRELTYNPLSVAAPFGLERAVHLRMEDLLHRGGARRREGALAAVDPERRRALSSAGLEIGYDALLVAVGAEKRNPLSGALAFSGREQVEPFRRLLGDLEQGKVRRVVFALPCTRAWPLPLYELALMTAHHLRRRGVADAELTLLTPEERTLGLFGPKAAAAVELKLREAGLVVRTDACPTEVEPDRLRLVGGEEVAAERVVTVGIARGRRIPGLPADAEGFLRTDEHARVVGLDEIYAAGDVTSFPLKQGGVAAQQADTAAAAIAAAAGALVTPRPFRPVLRGMLLTGTSPAYLRREVGTGHNETLSLDGEPLWWPPAKIVATYLGPFLAELAGSAHPSEVEEPEGLLVSWEASGDANDWHQLGAGLDHARRGHGAHAA